MTWGSPKRARPKIYNAGASAELGRIRVFRHRAGGLVGSPEWIDTSAPSARREDVPWTGAEDRAAV